MRGFCVACSTLLGILEPLIVGQASVRFHASFVYRPNLVVNPQSEQ